jgi:hypothetical protein
MRPEEFLTLAVHLLSVPDPDPARCRSAISRAYYAALHFAVLALAEVQARPNAGPQGHSDVAMMLGNSGDSKLLNVSRSLDDLRSWRNDADYHLDRPATGSTGTARTAVEMATDLIKELRSFIGDSPRKALAEPIIHTYITKSCKGHII